MPSPRPAAKSTFLREGLHPVLDLFLQMARRAVHPYNHGDNEDRGEQHQKAFKPVFADLPMFQRDGRRETQGSGQAHAHPNEAGQPGAAGAVEIDEYNADNQSGLGTLTQSNKERGDQA